MYNSKYCIGHPTGKCRICKSETSNLLGEAYNYGEPDLSRYDIPANAESDFDKAAADYLEQLKNIPVDKDTKRLQTWRLKFPEVTNHWDWQLRHTLSNCFGRKEFRTKPSYKKFVEQIEKEKAKFRESNLKVRYSYKKNFFLCSDACFNMWLLKNGKS